MLARSDLSSKNDLTAVGGGVLGKLEDGYEVYPWFFCPEDNLLQRRANRDQVPYPPGRNRA